MNQFVLMGRLTKDPDVKNCQSLTVVRYILACDKPYSKNKESGSNFLPVVVFGKEAELAKNYFKKGMKVLVTGTIEPRTYVKDGKTVYTTDLVVQHQEFCERKQKSDTTSEKQNDNAESSENTELETTE